MTRPSLDDLDPLAVVPAFRQKITLGLDDDVLEKARKYAGQAQTCLQK